MTALFAMRKFLKLDDAAGVNWILQESGKWKPTDYDDEIERRMSYLDGDMTDDWEQLLQAEFPTTWRDMEEKMLGYSIARFIIKRKAQAFKGKGQRFFLKDRTTGEEIDAEDPSAKAFSDLCSSSGLLLALADADCSVEIAHACALRVWSDRGQTRVSHYDPHKVHLAINPDREWDPQSSMAVAFERPSKDGLTGTERYEVYASEYADRESDTIPRDPFGSRIYTPTYHYVVDGAKKVSVNPDNVNPFRDRVTGEPIYPFTWLTDVVDQVYYLGGDDLVLFNRLMNLGMTYLHHNLTWQMAAIPNFEYPVGSNLSGVVNGSIMSSPNRALSLPAGVKLTFVRPDVEIDPFIGAYQTFMKMFALINDLPGRSMDVQGGAPESGISKMMEMAETIKHRDEMIGKYKDQVDDLLEKMIVVHNTYADLSGKPVIPDNLVGDWDSGTIDSGPIDAATLNQRYKVETDSGVSSIDEWCASLHNVDIQTARAMVDENVVRNMEVAAKMTRYSPDVSEAVTSMLTTMDQEAKADSKPPAENPFKKKAEPEAEPENDDELGDEDGE